MALKRVLGFQPDTRYAVLIFGLFHGFWSGDQVAGISYSRRRTADQSDCLNIGVEIGQFAALAIILILISAWRHSATFSRFAVLTNTLLMASGIMLTGYQLTGYFTSRGVVKNDKCTDSG